MNKVVLAKLNSLPFFLRMDAFIKVVGFKLLFVIAFINIGCYSTTDVDLPNEKSFLVVNSINFQPDSTWLIEVSKSSSYQNNNDHALIENAMVSIKDEQQEIIQLEPIIIKDKVFYSSDQKPVTGKQYELKVEAPGFNPVSSKSKLPSPIAIHSVIVDSTILREAYNFYKVNGNYGVYADEIIKCKISFYDPANEENFYQLKLYRETEWMEVDTEGNPIQKYSFTPSGFYLDRNGLTNLMIINDEMFNGSLYSWDVMVPMSAFYDFRFRSRAGHKLKLHFTLRHLSSAYFDYHETLELQNIRGSNPFSQPVIVYSNIENGVGIFAGFSQSVTVLKNH
ncbi:MAG: DUF4249 domain-containing protein [Cytophagia bacterium]|nr:DUF4249 domain-containing protein [Cytophagia bacterium]